MPWYRGIAPAYLTLFIWAPFFDQLWVADVCPRRAALALRQRGSRLAHLFRTVLPGRVVGFERSPRARGGGVLDLRRRRLGMALRARHCLRRPASGTPSRSTSPSIPPSSACGPVDLLAPSGVAHLAVGPLDIKSPVFLGTALFWIYITRQAIRMRLPGVVVGLMKVYSPIAVLLLAATAAWRLPTLWADKGGSGAAALLESASVQPPRSLGALLDHGRLLRDERAPERRLGGGGEAPSRHPAGRASVRSRDRRVQLDPVAPGRARKP